MANQSIGQSDYRLGKFSGQDEAAANSFFDTILSSLD
jgi:hypothetical protein